MNETAPSWQIRPGTGIGPIRLGASRSDVDEVLGVRGEVSESAAGYPTEVWYEQVGTRLSLDEAGIIREIEVFDPARPAVDGRDVLGQDVNAARSLFKALGCELQDDGDEGYKSSACGVRLWTPEERVVTVVVFDTTDGPPKVTPDELLERLGIRSPQRFGTG